MGKRTKGVALRTVFIRYLLLSGIFGVTFLAVAVLLMFVLQNMGVLYRANAGVQACYKAIPLVQEMTAEDFAKEVISAPCRYAVFAEQKSDAQVYHTNMNEKQLAIARDSMRDVKKNSLYSQFHETVPLMDGAVCLLQFDYAVAYVDPGLQSSLPDFQISYFLLVLLIIIAGLALITGHYARLILRETRLLTATGERIVRQRNGEMEADADAEPDRLAYRSVVREFREALENMEELHKETQEAFAQQWRAEQERREGIAALAHDLKTPLTVIGGNAELLLEEALSKEQRLCAGMIARNVEYARSYVDRLRQVIWVQGMEAERKQTVFLPDFYEDCCREGEALCRQRRILLRCAVPPELFFTARKEELHRALFNMLDNAVRFTPGDGEVRFTAEKEGEFIRFTVADSGPGFCGEALQKAGQMFYTSDSARTREGHQGLGLYFARQTAMRHGGSLTVGNGDTGGWVCLRIRHTCS